MAECCRDQWIVIGISGVTCGGKTTLANRLLDTLYPVHVFHQDKYFYPDDSPHHLRCPQLEHNNYDVVSALDMARMVRDVRRALAGRGPAHASAPAPAPAPDPGPAPGSAPASDRCRLRKRCLVLEGFTVLNFPPFMELCDLRYYFVLEYSECAARRAYRLYDPPDVPGYFDHCVWPEHLRYRAEIEGDGRVTMIDGTQHNAMDIVMADLKALGVIDTEQ